MFKCKLCSRVFPHNGALQSHFKTHFRKKIHCLQCDKETTNPKFCSKSCSAIWTNKHCLKKQKKKRFCKRCGVEIDRSDKGVYNFCKQCNPNRRDWSKISLKDLQSLRKYQINSRIRGLARIKFHRVSEYKCYVCGYSKHIEVCHKKPINQFSLDSSIDDINDISNLVGLCPNCHWEFDNGLLHL